MDYRLTDASEKEQIEKMWRKLQHEVGHYAGYGHPDADHMERCGKRKPNEEKEAP